MEIVKLKDGSIQISTTNKINNITIYVAETQAGLYVINKGDFNNNSTLKEKGWRNRFLFTDAKPIIGWDNFELLK